MRWLWRADLGIKEIAYRTAQNLYSLHGSRQFTRAPKVRVTVSASLLMDRVQIKISARHVGLAVIRVGPRL